MAGADGINVYIKCGSGYIRLFFDPYQSIPADKYLCLRKGDDVHSLPLYENPNPSSGHIAIRIGGKIYSDEFVLPEPQ